MSIDGANLGVKASDAVKAIMGGEQPSEETKLTREEMLKKVMAAPDNYKDIPYEEKATDEGYDRQCMWLARQFYLLRKEGKEGDSHQMFNLMKERCGEADYDFTGFMVGYANNLSRWLMNKPEVENPAIITINA